MNLDELERLVTLVKDANIGELTLKQNGARITIRRQTADNGGALTETEAEYFQEAMPAENGTAALELREPVAEEKLTLVNAPLVGVFHHVKPIVGLGAKVAPGQVIATIEAMRLINEIIAPIAGKVVDVLVEDSMPVEYGQTLFALQPLD